jgi:formylglycine-generating enzyme required for sulfatase activity
MARVLYFTVLATWLVGCAARPPRPPAAPVVAAAPALRAAPAAPGDVKAKAGSGWAWVGWKAAAGVTSYTVFRSESAKGPWRLRAVTKGLSYTDRRVRNGTTYFYSARSLAEGRRSAFSRMARATPRAPAAPAYKGPPPAAPYGLSGGLTPKGAVGLLWVDAATTETGYRVMRRGLADTKFATVAKLPRNFGAYNDSSAGGGQSWVYRVYAVAGTTVSGYSNAFTVSVPLAAPQKLVAHALSESTVRLSWVPSKGHTGYKVERRRGNGPFQLAAVLPASARAYDNRRLRPRQKYTYRIRATGKEGDSPVSNESAAVTRPMPVLGSTIKLAGGCYRMGAARGGSDARAHHVCLKPFAIDVFEVTNAQYLTCLRAGACTAPAEYSAPRRPNYFMAASTAAFPVVNVSWAQADAYCRYKGKRLPTEAEWEYAARGGARGAAREAAAPDCRLANIDDGASCRGSLLRVAAYPPNDAGAYDMVGNAWEWTADYYDEGYYAKSPVTEPTGPGYGEHRVRRGGSFTSAPVTARPDNRAFAYADANATTGFRCAK